MEDKYWRVLEHNNDNEIKSLSNCGLENGFAPIHDLKIRLYHVKQLSSKRQIIIKRDISIVSQNI